MEAEHSRISSRIARVPTSATSSVDAMAKALKAAGRPVIGFGAGEPDFPTPQAVVDAAVSACKDPNNHHYTSTGGLPELRRAVAVKTLRDSGWQVEPSQVLITNGAKQAVFEAFATILNPGDEVLLPAPYWTTYPEAARMAGGEPVQVDTDGSTGFLPTIKALEAARTPRTKVLLWCSPSNPTGAVAPRDLVEAVGRWAADRSIWVIADEIYEHYVYDGAQHFSMPAVVPAMADRCIVVNGVAKTYAMTGWRVGWLIGPQDVVVAATNMQSHLTSHVCNVAQRAALAAVSGSIDSVKTMRVAFDRRRRILIEMLSAIEGLHCPIPHGAFYAYVDVRALLGRELRGARPQTSADLAAAILEHAEVAVVPGEAFGAPGYFRMSYALGEDDLRRGVRRMAELLSEIS